MNYLQVHPAHIMRKLLIGSLLLIFHSLLNAKDYEITSFGAKSGGIDICTVAIQSAIDKASKEGGGKVIVPKGIFLTGTIFLKNNVELHVQKDAVLLGSTLVDDYQKVNGDYALLIATDQQNIAISGEGTIDGQGGKLALAIDSLHHAGIMVDKGYNYRRMRPGSRPNLVKMNRCQHVKITGIRALNAASWVLRLNKCEQLEIDRVQVESDVFWNNDGIDIEDCKKVRIINSYINAADDAVCLKSNDPNSYCDEVYIANNTIRSSASAIKFGTASFGGFKNVTIEDITIYDTFRSALAFEAVDGGAIENIYVTNVFAVNTGNAVFIKLGHRNVNGLVGTIKNITIKGLHVHIPFGAPDLQYNIRGPELPFFHNPFPASITGLPGHLVENVTLEDVSISYPGRANEAYAHVPLWRLDSVPESASQYPEFHMFGELPSWGFYVRHVDGLALKNVRISVRDNDFRPAYVFDDVKDLSLEGGSITSLGDHTAVVLKDTQSVQIKNVKVDGNDLEFVSSYGENAEVSGVKLLKKTSID